ncbi:MAG: hypothetical protein ACYCQI_14745 [Gammaproteobacteria bacterium]
MNNLLPHKTGEEPDFMLKEKLFISPKEAEKLIFDMVRYSNNTYSYKMKNVTDINIKKWFAANKVQWRDLVAKARKPGIILPFVENIVGADFTVICSAEGGVTTTVMHHGHESAKLVGSGQISMAGYHSKYTMALEARRDAINKGSYSELLNCATHGIASIEAYISSKANIWNKQHNRIVFPVDAVSNLDTKLDWLIVMTGQALEKQGAIWNHFSDYRNLNNGNFKHNATGAQAASFNDMVKVLNKFRTGIAEILFKLHMLCKEPVPSNIVRGMYLPEVFV